MKNAAQSQPPTPEKEVRPEFWTTDLYLAAFLQTEEVVLLRTETELRGRCQFVFLADVKLTSLKTAWFARGATTNASRYADNIRSLKSLVHSGARQ
jgi:hypothetical protein